MEVSVTNSTGGGGDGKPKNSVFRLSAIGDSGSSPEQSQEVGGNRPTAQMTASPTCALDDLSH